MLLLGLLAFGNVLAATLVSVAWIGAMMFVGGLMQICHSFQVRRWTSFVFWLLSGLLYGAAGIAAFYDPVLVAGVLTLLLAAAMLVAGALRIAVGLRSRRLHGWGWVVASGAVTLMVGIIVALGWPANALWLLGLILAIDLTFQGATAVVFGLTLKSST
jgi:uncharacterized membrane protein HdeD (DUF308 family)